MSSRFLTLVERPDILASGLTFPGGGDEWNP